LSYKGNVMPTWRYEVVEPEMGGESRWAKLH
jgi:hypothetical protein